MKPFALFTEFQLLLVHLLPQLIHRLKHLSVTTHLLFTNTEENLNISICCIAALMLEFLFRMLHFVVCPSIIDVSVFVKHKLHNNKKLTYLLTVIKNINCKNYGQ